MKQNNQPESDGSAIIGDTLRMCENCQTGFGQPIEETDEYRTYKCPRCKREYKQYNGF